MKHDTNETKTNVASETIESSVGFTDFDSLEERKVNPMLDGPIPGEGLTSDPTTPDAWETPPQYTSTEAYMEFIGRKLMDNLEDVMGPLREGLELDLYVETILQESFQGGLINLDVVMLSYEPLAVMLIGLAEQTGTKFELSDNVADDEEALFDAIIPNVPEASDVPENSFVPSDKLRNSLRNKRKPKNKQNKRGKK